jgi:hypothetical protein
MLVYYMATQYAPLHITMFCISTLCASSYAYVLWQHTINNFILLYSVAAHCAPLQVYYILWQHNAPLYYVAYCGNTVHHLILLHGNTLCATSFCLTFCSKLCATSFRCILWQHIIHHFIQLYSMANHYASLHMTQFCGNFVLLYSAATQYACVWPTKDLHCMSCVTCTCKKSGLVIVCSCTQGRLKYNLSRAT